MRMICIVLSHVAIRFLAGDNVFTDEGKIQIKLSDGVTLGSSHGPSILKSNMCIVAPPMAAADAFFVYSKPPHASLRCYW